MDRQDSWWHTAIGTSFACGSSPSTGNDVPWLPMHRLPLDSSGFAKAAMRPVGENRRRPGIVRARPLGESVELISGDEGQPSADNWSKRPPSYSSSSTSERRRQRSKGACGRACVRGWSAFVAGAQYAISKPRTKGEVIEVDEPNTLAQDKPQELGFRDGMVKLLSALFWDIIHPDSIFRTAWDINIILLLFYVAFVTTYLLAFDFTSVDTLEAFLIVDFVINSCFLIDICLNFRTGLRKGETAATRNFIITDRHKIAVDYLTSGFLIDLMAGLPWGQMTETLGSYMQLTKLLRLVRLLRLFSVPKSMQRNSLYQDMEYRQGVAMWRVVMYVVGAIIVLHLSASAWFFTAVMEDRDLVGTWADAAGLIGASPVQQYLTSLYFVVITYTTVGYGDVCPVTTAERFIACCMMLLGVATLGYIISTANSIAGNANKYELAKAALRDQVDTFLDEQPLPAQLAARVKHFYDFLGRKQFSNEGDDKLVQSLPVDLRRDVLRAMHASLIRQVPFFKAASERHEDLVLDLTAVLRVEFFCKDQCVVMEGGWDTEMYFVTEGQLIVYQYTLDELLATAAREQAQDEAQNQAHAAELAAAEHQIQPGADMELARLGPPQSSTASQAPLASAKSQGGAGGADGTADGETGGAARGATNKSELPQATEFGDTVQPSADAADVDGIAADANEDSVPSQQRRKKRSRAVESWLRAAAASTATRARAAADAAAAVGLQAASSPASAVTSFYGGMTTPTTEVAAQQLQQHHQQQQHPPQGQQDPQQAQKRPAGRPAGLRVVSPFEAPEAQQADEEMGDAVDGGNADADDGTWTCCPEVPFQPADYVELDEMSGVSQRLQDPPPPPEGAGMGDDSEQPSEPVPPRQRRRAWRMLYNRTVPQRAIARLKPGHYFGEYSCLSGCPRTASVVTSRMTELYCLRRADLEAALGRWPALLAIWQSCQSYGADERSRLYLYLRGGRAPLAMSLFEEDSLDWPTDDPIIRSEVRYRQFMRYLQRATAPAPSAAAAPAAAATGAAGA